MTRCSSTGKMTAAWCCNHEGIETTQTGGRAAAGHRHPFFWLFLFFLLPFIIVVKISFAESGRGHPPYTDVVSWADNQLTILLNLGNYCCCRRMTHIAAYLGSLKIALVSTMLCLLIGYPMAYAISRANKETQTVLLLLIMMPTWTAILIGSTPGWGSSATTACSTASCWASGVIDEPLQILNTNLAVYIGIVYSHLPFMVLPLYANLVKHDQSLLEAASDLGACNLTWFWQITVPLQERHHRRLHADLHPGGGRVRHPRDAGWSGDLMMISKVLWQEFFNNRDWPVASRPGGGDAGGADHSHHPVQPQPGQRAGGQGMRRFGFAKLMLWLGLLFIYLPMIIMVIYSFNASKLVTVWGAGRSSGTSACSTTNS